VQIVVLSIFLSKLPQLFNLLLLLVQLILQRFICLVLPHFVIFIGVEVKEEIVSELGGM